MEDENSDLVTPLQQINIEDVEMTRGYGGTFKGRVVTHQYMPWYNVRELLTVLKNIKKLNSA